MQSSALLLDEEPIERSKSQLVHFAAAAAANIFCESHHEISSTVTEPGYSSLKEIHKDDKLSLPDNDFESQTGDMDDAIPNTYCCKIGSTSTQWHAILCGQLLSVALTVSSATSLALNSKNSSSSSDSSGATNPIISVTPTFSLLCMYLLLALIHFTYWLYCQRQERQQAITALILSNLTSAVDCTLDEAYHTLADKRHSSTIFPNCNSNSNKTSTTNDQNSVMKMIVEPTANSPQIIDMELDLLERNFFPVSRYKFLQVLCCSSAPFNLHSYSWKQYCALALIHVQGNYCLLKSFQYESFKTVILLQSISIPAAMITSAIFLRRHYTCLHILGAILCIFGSALTFRDAFFSSGSSRGSDITTTTSTTIDLFPNPIIGDLLAVSSAILSGVSDVFAEQAVKYNGSIIEYLAMIGFFGTIISAIQVVLLDELPHVINLLLNVSTCVGCETDTTSVTSEHLLLLCIFTCFSYMFFAGMCRFLLFSEATFLNLSMLSTDLWSIGFSIVQEHMFPSYEFFLSFITIATGVVAYQKAPSPIVTDKDGEIELEHHDHQDEDSMEEPRIILCNQ